MIVLRPQESPYIIQLKARRDIPSNSTIFVYSEDYGTSEEISPMQIAKSGGITSVRFQLDANEGESYSFKIVGPDGIVHYRGKLFITAQNPQTYKKDNDTYVYSSI